MPAIVKGCQMPALNRSPTRSQQNWPGRRRTSLEGGNREIYQDWSRQATGYGDWVGYSAVLPDQQAGLPDEDLPQAAGFGANSPRFRCGRMQETWILRHQAKPSRIGSDR